MISIKTREEIEIMREGGKITAAILNTLKEKVRPGISTKEIDVWAAGLIKEHGAKSSFKGYRGFPAVICTSVNEEIVHAPPSKKKILKEADILTLDFGVIYKEFHTDSAITFGIGKISEKTRELIEVTREVLRLGVEKAWPGNTLGDIGSVIQEYVESRGYGVVRELAGHGIGRKLHEDPFVLNYGKAGTGLELKEGMVIAIEPMVTEEDWHTELAKDKFTYLAKDRKLSAHFEHTVAITVQGPTILTSL